MTLIFKVDDMSCSHCEMTIRKGLQELEGVSRVAIDLAQKSVAVETDLDAEIIMEKIRESGYHPSSPGSS